jgi:hypothetical protein
MIVLMLLQFRRMLPIDFLRFFVLTLVELPWPNGAMPKKGKINKQQLQQWPFQLQLLTMRFAPFGM